MSRRALLLLLVLSAPSVLVGCGQQQAPVGPPQGPPPEVLVSEPITRQVTDYEDFPGRTESLNFIEVRARVSGYLHSVNFKEGADVKENEVLFEIDPLLYEAELNRAEATLVQGEARVKRLDTEYQRAQNLLRTRTVSQEDFEKVAGDRLEAIAAVGVAKATLKMAAQDVEFTKVKAKISGRTSRRYVDPGNIVKKDETILTTLVSLDPMRATFDLDERTSIKLQKLLREGKINWSTENKAPVLLGLPDEEGYSKQGTIDFTDNRMDPETGTWRLMARFDNHELVLSPGMFVRIRLPIGLPYMAHLVAEQALGTDQGQKFVYIAKEDGQVAYRKVRVGRLHDGLRVILPPTYKEEEGKRVIQDGIEPHERLVVSGLQRIRPGAPVTPKLVNMPGAKEDKEKGRQGDKETKK